jgi:hypothetical protein
LLLLDGLKLFIAQETFSTSVSTPRPTILTSDIATPFAPLDKEYTMVRIGIST